MELRNYQKRAIQSVVNSFNNGAISGVVAMATGTGKTVVTHEVTMTRFPPEQYRTLIIGGVNIDVCNQMEAAFLVMTPDLAGYYGENGRSSPGIGVVMADRDDANSRIVVASIQTLLADKVEEYVVDPGFSSNDVYMDGDRIFKTPTTSLPYLVSPRLDAILREGKLDFWVHDEVHHAPADGTLGLIRRLRVLYEFLGLEPMRFMGNTATPVRPDGRALFNVCERVFYSYPLHKAQEEGWIVPFADPQRVVVDLGYNNPHTSEYDVRVDSLSNWTEMVAKTWRDLCLNNDGSHRPTIIYTGNIHEYGPVEASKVLSASLNEQGIKSVHIDAIKTIDTDGAVLPKKERLKAFKRLMTGDIQVICNCNVIVEGIDIPPISSIFLLKKVNELVLTQIVGRGTRLFPGNDYLPAKEDLLVVDFTGQQLVTSAICSLMGYMVDDENNFEEDWEALWEEFVFVWDSKFDEIKIWLSDMQRLREDMYLRFEEAINLALHKDHQFTRKHARLIRQMILVFGENALLDERDLVDAGFIQGKDVVYKLAEIVSSTDNDWATDTDTGMMYLPVGSDESLFITPPNWSHKVTVEASYRDYLQQGDRTLEKIKLFGMALNMFGKFTLWRITTPKPYNGKARPLYSDENLIELFNSSMNYIMEQMSPEDIFMKKGRKWKAKKTDGKRVEPTSGQIYAIRKLSRMNNVPEPNFNELSKGEASKLINFLAGAVPIKKIFTKVNGALSLGEGNGNVH